MAQNLKQYLDTHPPKGFKPVPHYFPNGDFVTYYFRPDRCYSQRVDDLLTVFLAMGNNELVGCKIKGVSHILKSAGNFGVTLDDGDVRLGFFFFVGAATARSERQKKRYEELSKVAQDAKVLRRELEKTCAAQE